MISVAEPKQVASKIKSIHNRHACRVCQRPLDGGVLTFGLSGSDARWYPDEQHARAHTPGARYVFPVREDDVNIEEVLAWVQAQRDELEQLVEHIEQAREEKRMARAYRADQAGFRVDPFPCADCGHPKYRPADRCEHCGDEPTTLGADPHEYNRGYGYRD